MSMKLLDALPDVDPRILSTSEGRREATKYDPLLFARVYFPHHLRESSSDDMTLCSFHLDMLEWARVWTDNRREFKKHRDCFIAPRQSGKSTWTFLLLPMWAGAHGHREFVAAFSDAGSQAETHLYTFKQELETNELLRKDFPEFTEPMRRGESGRTMMQNRNQIQQSTGFVFMAKGADTAALGMKVGAKRPDVILFDDIEPGESNYSPFEAGKRLNTVLSDLLPLNYWAVVGFVGTTTMPDSIIDQIRKVGKAREEYEGDPDYFRDYLQPELRWVVDENIKVHYYPVIVQEQGVEVSLWPERWPMAQLNLDRHTRSFAKNMMNRPVSLDGGYWDEADIDVDSTAGDWGNTILAVDPAVTTAKRSDYTGLAVISRSADKNDKNLYVRHAEQVKLSSEALREHVETLVQRYGCKVVLVETNQGGDLWKQVFSGLPAKLRLKRVSEKKEVRAGQAHDFYKKGMVKHTRTFPILEEQMLAFPKVPHDDVLDAVVAGILYFKAGVSQKVQAIQIKYREV